MCYIIYEGDYMARPSSNKTNNTSRSKKNNDKMVDIKVVEKDIADKLKKMKTVKKVTKNDDKNYFSLFEVILLIIITILSCILIGYLVQPKKKATVSVDIADKNIKKFAEQYQYILDMC